MRQSTAPETTSWPTAVIATLAVLNTVGAAVGAVGLATGLLDLGETIEQRIPGDSPVVGGLALALLVAAPHGLLSVLALRRDQRTAFAAVVVGAALIGWLAVELAFIRELSFFHPLYLAVGLVMMAAGAELGRRAATLDLLAWTRSS